MNLPLSVLDLSPVPSGSGAGDALRNTLDLARHTDRLGYTRYWMAEHHNMPAIASSAPEIMMGLVARETERIRVGSGGIMLPNHSPLKVAEWFHTLEALYPGRMDIGLGRAPGTDPVTAMALRRSGMNEGAEDFPDQLADLFSFSEGEFPPDHPFRTVRAYPRGVTLPPVWLLGSSTYSAQLSAQMGLRFAFAAHFSPHDAADAMRIYRVNFTPSEYNQKPHAIITLSVICADTEEEAEHLAASIDLFWVRFRSGRMAPVPSPEEALAYAWTPAERALAKGNRRQHMIGTPATVREQIRELAERTDADEVMVTSMIHSHKARLRSYELLAEAFELQGQA